MTGQEHDAVQLLTGAMVRIVAPCLRDEEIVTFREEAATVIREHLRRYVDKVRRMDKRLGRPAAGWGEGGVE